MGQQIDFCEEITVLLGESSRCGFNQSIFIPQGWSDSIQRKFTEATNLNSFKMVFVVLLHKMTFCIWVEANKDVAFRLHQMIKVYIIKDEGF